MTVGDQYHCSGVEHSLHSLAKMDDRDITFVDVAQIVRTGYVIAHYPDTKPYSCSLLLGWTNGKPLHVVLAQDETKQCRVITTYWPDPALWNETFTEKLKRK
jgi:hypothetical protein